MTVLTTWKTRLWIGLALLSLLFGAGTALAARPVTDAPAAPPVPATKPAPGLGPANTGITITIDGVHEAAWGAALATDAQGDMSEPNLDLTTLYMVEDTNNFYFGFDAGNTATGYGMNYGIAIDTDGVTGSGGTSHPWGRAVNTVAAHLPEYYLNVWDPGDGTIGNAQLNAWTGGGWTYPDLISLGGAQGYSAANHWIEYRVPKSALGNPARLWVELYTTGGGGHAQDTVPSDPNVAYSAPDWGGATTTLSSFAFYEAMHPSAHDNNIEYNGLGHNSQDPIYRQPAGAVIPGTPVKLRFRTYHDDVTSVRVRFYDTATSSEFFQDMTVTTADTSCYQPGLGAGCDYWETTVTPTQLTTLYYRFIVIDGTATAYYADDNFMDGGWGSATPTMIDNSYDITVYDPAFQPITWMKNAVIYQIFPDRFFNGNQANDPTGSAPRYGYPPDPLDQILHMSWLSLPEGYCRNYINPAQPCTESPRGRDYFGGDLQGITAKLDYLKGLGVNTLYLNPIFDSASNHGYDTQNYFAIDPAFGTQADWTALAQGAQRRNMRIILDGVFNHVSSDSVYFDRYHHFDTVGACESVSSPYRSWFTFHDQANGPCAGPNGPNTMTYDGWFGFDSLPVLNKNVQAVRDLVYAQGTSSVAPYWLSQGASGWRLDVMGDGSFPADYWQQFRQAVKTAKPDAPIIGELWKKGEMLPKIHGDQADSTMNYRFRNAIDGFFGTIDNKGFPDDGQSNQPPSLFARKLNSVREDYPDAVYYTLLNLIDSHDTERALWSMTAGQSNREDREFNLANLEKGKQRLRLAVAVQFTVPGAPTVYYGDEQSMTGADDPDNRRPFPLLSNYHNAGDPKMQAYYTSLAALRAANPVFRNGTLQFLLTDDADRVLAYGLRTLSPSAAAIVVVNRAEDLAHTVSVPLSGYLRDGVTFTDALSSSSHNTATSAGGALTVMLPPMTAAVWIANAGQDLTAPPPPARITATPSNNRVAVSWGFSSTAVAYRLYRSEISGGGWQFLVQTGGRTYTDTGVVNSRRYYYRVTALDAAGNESGFSPEATALPAAVITWAGNLSPATLTITINASQTHRFTAEVLVPGVTEPPGQGAGVAAAFAYGPVGSDPSTWTWLPMTYDGDAGTHDRYRIDLTPEMTGRFDYLARFTTDNGGHWTYAYTGSGGTIRGRLTVNPSSDLTPPAPPANLHIVHATGSYVALAWDPNGEPDLYRYEVWRGTTGGGPYTKIANVTAPTTQYTDNAVATGTTYYYVITAQDTSFNRSDYSNEVSAQAVNGNVTMTFYVTLPSYTPAGDTIHIAGSFPAPYPQWDPGGLPLTRDDTTHAHITLTMPEGTALQYKYTRGSWDSVEKGPNCEEIPNRQLTVTFGQDQYDTVAKWRDLDHCQ